jgi:hypothetical protein
MTNPTPISAELILDASHAKHQGPMLTAFSAIGVRASVKVLPPRRGPAELQWLVLAVLPLQAFLAALGGQFGDDSYRGLQNAVRYVFRHKESKTADATAVPPRPIVLQDKTTGIQVVLDHDLPTEGYEQLLGLDLSKLRFGPVHYDRDQRRWRSELDEADSLTT